MKKPESLNGHQLKKELFDGGIIIENDSLGIEYDELVFDIIEGDEKEAKKIVAKHRGIDGWYPGKAEKELLLQKLGITEDEAKLLLS